MVADFANFSLFLPQYVHSFLALMQAIVSTQFQDVFWGLSGLRLVALSRTADSHHVPGPPFHFVNVSFLRACTSSSNSWSSRGNSSKAFSVCKCTRQEQVRLGHWEQCVSEFLCFYTWMCHPVLMRTLDWKRASVTRLSLFVRCRFVTGTTSSPPIRRSPHLRLCITWVASMWRTTWWPQQMTSSGPGECKPALTFG